MERLVRVLHRIDGGGFTVAFEWTTKKSGDMDNVMGYLLNKFRVDPPKGYAGRPLQPGDRFEITDTTTKETRTFKILSAMFYVEV